MATSTVDIVNKALNHLAVSPIASLTEDSEPAERASAIYESVRDEVLRGWAWGFATKITTLAEISDETVPGYEYLYLYPSNCLRIRKIFEDTSAPDPVGVDFEECISPDTGQRALAASVSPAYVRYTFKVSDPNSYDPVFIECLALKLAANLAHHLTGDKQLGPQLLNIFVGSISEAKRLGSIERHVTDISESSFHQARG